VGTLFLPHSSNLPAWKRWLGYTARPRGRVVVDEGARNAVQHQGRSLLSIGIVAVSGSFGKGDVVSICDPDGVEFARGLTNYPAAVVDRLRGVRTERIREVLGSCPYEEVVHRDNLVVMV
jgi:glutamate 5-kinase